MDKEYFYNYLKNYILEVGDRIIGLNKAEIDGSKNLHEFLEARAQSAYNEYRIHCDGNTPPGGAMELAMEVLFSGLKDLEPDEEERIAEENYRKEREEEERMLRESGSYD